MPIGTDAEILAAVYAVIANRAAGAVLQELYNRSSSVSDKALDALAEILPIEQIAITKFVDKLNHSGLPTVVILLATLRRLRTEEVWVHYNLTKHLNALLRTGVSEAKLPAIIHALLTVEGLQAVQPTSLTLPLGVLASELAAFAPREAVRSGMRAVRHADAQGLHLARAAFVPLGLEDIAERPAITQLIELATALHFSPDTIPQTTSLSAAAGLQTTVVEPATRFVFPKVHGDASHYMFVAARREVELPRIAVHSLSGGIFSIDATSRGREHHYVFDKNENCVLELANGTNPFVAETLLECDEPVAILDDQFSGSALNICHFLLDRITRIAVYEKAWSRPGKFLLSDDYPYQRDIIARMGMTDRFIFPTTKRVSVRAPEILFSSNIAGDFRHPAHNGSRWALDYLRRVLGIDDRSARPERKIVISRGDARGRKILNWDDVLATFHGHGFEAVELAQLSAEAQIELFRDAAQVVGVHGAGLTNILFAPRDCAVLEILPPLVATRAYWLLASGLGQYYATVIADDPEFSRPDYETWRHNPAFNDRNVILPVDRLASALTAIDQGYRARIELTG